MRITSFFMVLLLLHPMVKYISVNKMAIIVFYLENLKYHGASHNCISPRYGWIINKCCLIGQAYLPGRLIKQKKYVFIMTKTCSPSAQLQLILEMRQT